ncbi:hypothetical protein HanRHA438_Chr14g0630381 [Helianthus annuus]|nr:hypothetical protein HanRHA438_Chr14g0630381 [Helianthus annuus]
MSGERSSQAAGKKRKRIRDPVRYNGPEERPLLETPVLPLEQRVLQEHTLLDFALGSMESKRLDRFCTLRLYKHHTINWEMLEAIGQRQRMEEFSGPRWVNALRCVEPQYAELTTEFHSTFRYDADRYVEPYTLSFYLGRQQFMWSVDQFARAAGFYA